jgi:hypothetical protein
MKSSKIAIKTTKSGKTQNGDGFKLVNVDGNNGSER